MCWSLTRAIRHTFEGDRKEWTVNDRVKRWAPRTDTITSILLLQVLGCDFYLAGRWSHYNCKDYHRLDVPLYIYHCLSWYFLLCNCSYLKRRYLFGLVLGVVGEGVGHWTYPNNPFPYNHLPNVEYVLDSLFSIDAWMTKHTALVHHYL